MNIFESIVSHSYDAPRSVALTLEGDKTTYQDLALAANTVRKAVKSLGLHKGEAVVVRAEKSPGTIATILACFLERSPVLAIAADTSPELLSTLCAKLHCRFEIAPSGIASQVIKEKSGPDAPEGTAIIFTTSGTTGTPKLVPLSFEAIDRFAQWASEAFGLSSESTVLSFAPLNFDLSLLDVWTTLAYGGQVALISAKQAVDGQAMAQLIHQTKVTVVQAVPMFFTLLDDTAELTSVQHLIFTGEPMHETSLRRTLAQFPQSRRYNIYGSTETNDVLWHEICLEDDLAAPIPIGTTIPGVTAIVVGVDGEAIAGPGKGELWVSSPFQTAGYLDLTGKISPFATHPSYPETNFFRSGDLVERTENGSFIHLGRRDSQVKIRGVRVNLHGIEEVLMNHPEILEAVVAPTRDPISGHEVLAVVRRAERSVLNSLQIRSHCISLLPRAAVPKFIRITDDPLPRTATGKLDRLAARQI